MAVRKLPRLPSGSAVLDGDFWNQRLAPAIERNMLESVVGGDLINTASGQAIRIRYSTSLLTVMFQSPTSIYSFYLGWIYTGTPTGPLPNGLTQGNQVYIQNLQEYNKTGWPTTGGVVLSRGSGPPGLGFFNGNFTDPATGVSLPLITVIWVATGPCP